MAAIEHPIKGIVTETLLADLKADMPMRVTVEGPMGTRISFYDYANEYQTGDDVLVVVSKPTKGA